MPRRIIEVDGAQWQVAVSGRSPSTTRTSSDWCSPGARGPIASNVVRYSPLGAKSGLSLARLSDRELADLLAVSQPGWTSPERLPPLTATGQAPPAGPSIDLHVHSSASDGSLAPEAVVSRARPRG